MMREAHQRADFARGNAGTKGDETPAVASLLVFKP